MTHQEYNDVIDYLRKIIKNTKWDGHLFAVGGCCRDYVMNLPINDIDLAVDTPDGGIKFAMWLYKRHRLLLRPVIYPRFGTAMFRLKRFPECELEIVQTRKEKYTDKNSRNPAIAFGSKEEDALRRDFTINTLFYDISRSKLIDITGKALHDIKNKIVRTPLSPFETFDDDPVRIYRGIRFAAKLNWQIDPTTYQGMIDNIPRLEIVSPNRARGELMKIMQSPKPSRALNMLMDSGAMKYLIPELIPLRKIPQFPGSNTSVWDHTLQVVDAVENDPYLRVAALMHDIGKQNCKPQNATSNDPYPCHGSTGAPMVKRILRRLKFTTPFIAEVKKIVIHHMRFASAGHQSERLIDRKLLKFYNEINNPDTFRRLLELVHIDNITQPLPELKKPNQVAHLRKRLEKLVKLT